MTQAQSVAIESSQINSSGVLLTTGGGTGLSTVGTNGQVLTSNGTTLSWVTPTTTSPGGSTGQVQYNTGSAFGGSANLYWDNTNSRLGIGTASPDAPLTLKNPNVSGNQTVLDIVGATSSTTLFGVQANQTTDVISLGSLYAGQLAFVTNSTERMRITSSGNLGLGVTPSTSSQVTFEIGAVGNVITTNGTNDIQFTAGGYYNGGWKYAVTSSPVSSYYQDSGTHVWRYSASGTAGNAITWSEAMRITSTGNVGIGTTTPNTKLVPLSSTGVPLSSYTNTSAVFQGAYGVGNGGAIGFDCASNSTNYPTGIGYVVTNNAGYTLGDMVFGTRSVTTDTAPTERMRIDSSGNVKLSTASTSILNSSGRPMLNQTGGVLQVVNAVLTSSVSTSSTSMIDTGLSATITPSSTSSKILVLVTLNQMSCDNASLSMFAVTRNGSTFVYNSSGGNATSYQAFASGGGQSQNRQLTAGTLTYLDSPASTSAQTYKVRIANNGGGTAYLNQWALNSDAGGVSTITLMEIAQ